MSELMTQNPIPAPPRPSGAGCWIVGAFTLLLACVLVGVGLFLPPIRLYDRLFGEQYAMLSADNNGVFSADAVFSLAVAPDNPGDDFGARIEAISLRDFESGNAQINPTIPQQKGAVPPFLALQSAVYQIETTGRAPSSLVLSMKLPTNAERDLLDMYGWYAAENAWRFIPAQPNGDSLVADVSAPPDSVAIFQAASPPPTVVIAYDTNQVLPKDAALLATIVAPSGLQPALDGSLVGTFAPGFTTTEGYLVLPALRNYADPSALDVETISAILNNSALRREHVRQIVSTITSNNFDGVWIDYRGLPADLRDLYSAFIRELADGLAPFDLLLGVVVPPADTVNGVWETGAYDWRALGQAADYVQINLGTNPATFVPGDNQLVEAMLRWGIGEMSRYKIILGLSAQSIREIGGDFSGIGYDTALAGLGDVAIEAEKSEDGSIVPGTEIRAYLDGLDARAGVDTRINAPYVEYLNADGSVATRVWLTTGDALRFRMDWTIPFSLAGVAFEDLLASDLEEGVLTAITRYKAQIPAAPAPSDLALRWRIEGSAGLIDEIITDLSEDIQVTLAAPDGNYAINVAVIGVGEQAVSPRSGAAVALFQPTATPTPLPTATPTATPSPTPTLAAIVPTAAGAGGGAPVSGFGANRPGPGSINLSGFAYGGHVTSAGSSRAIGAMQRAGMTWMKVQVRYSRGASPAPVANDINTAHQNGFKILVGTVGSPSDLQNGGEGYLNDYANWLAGIAAAGADAIEVWNEPNLSREWPEGQISGAAYANMLAKAYTAIKSANGGTIVISGAPAPTGAENAFPGRVVNDDRFLRDFVAAGGLNYTDCVGAHYNEGIVPPSATSGDPRDNYYTRYFRTMLNTYTAIVGAKPICFTELGYLTPEGYGPLPEFFSWAQNVTIAQQAAWLAEAAAIASQSGSVRIMIVWNVDFTAYDSDPQAGYAILRPDGSCPACDALAGAR